MGSNEVVRYLRYLRVPSSAYTRIKTTFLFLGRTSTPQDVYLPFPVRGDRSPVPELAKLTSYGASPHQCAGCDHSDDRVCEDK